MKNAIKVEYFCQSERTITPVHDVFTLDGIAFMIKKSHRNAEDDEFGERLDSLDLPDFVLAQV